MHMHMHKAQCSSSVILNFPMNDEPIDYNQFRAFKRNTYAHYNMKKIQANRVIVSFKLHRFSHAKKMILFRFSIFFYFKYSVLVLLTDILNFVSLVVI